MSDSPRRARVLAEGTRVGPFLLQAHLGSGGNARVFRATQDDGRVVALKLLHPGRATAEDLKRFEREFKSLERLDHPNVIQVYQAGETDGHAWLAMEYVDGCDLGALVDGWSAQEPDDRWARVERILRGLCAALEAVHASGIVHRDLKPTNVLVGGDGVPKLTDFGVVKGDDLFSTNLTVAGQLLGTVAFMSPEQITGDGLDTRSDLYALGAMLYVLLTGERPVVADSIASYLARHLASEPRPPRELRPDAPETLCRICLRLLRKDPAARFQSASQVADALSAPTEEPRLQLQGRDGVLALVREALDDLAHGIGGALGVVGPRGAGRSAVLEVVAEEAAARDLPVEPGSAVSGQRAVILADDLHLREGLHLGDLISQVQSNGSLLIWSAVAAQGSRQPSSPSLVPQLARLGGPVVPLEPLARPDTVALLRRAGLVGRLGPLVGRRLHEELGGRPGAVVDQLAALERQGWLRREGGRLVAGVPIDQLKRAQLPVPARLKTELEDRVAKQPGPAQRYLEVLAVLGGSGSADLMRHLASIGEALGMGLMKAGLVRIQEEGLEQLVVLGPPRLAQVIAGGLSPDARAELHGRIADALLARHARRPGAMAPVMARHLVAADRPEEAWPLLVRAARRAARRRDPATTLGLATRAREAGNAARGRLPEERERALARETLALRGEALLACRKPSEAREALSAALALGGDEDATALTAKSALGAALVALGEADAAAQLLTPLLVQLPQGHPSRSATLRALAEALRQLGLVGSSEERWREALALAQELGSKDGEAVAQVGLAGVLLQRAAIVEARELLERALGALRSTRSPALARCLRNLAELEALDGRYRPALTLADEAAELAQGLEDLETWSGALAVTADVLDLAGRARDAERLRSEVSTVRAAVPPSVVLPRVSLAATDRLTEALDLESQGAHFPALGQAEEAWRLLPEHGAGGLGHRVALALCRLDPDTHRLGRAATVARAIVEELPPELAASFRARSDVQDLLA